TPYCFPVVVRGGVVGLVRLRSAVLHVRRCVAGYAVGGLLIDAAAVERRHRLGDDELLPRELRRKIRPGLVVVVVAQQVEGAGVKDRVCRTAVVVRRRNGPGGVEASEDPGWY